MTDLRDDPLATVRRAAPHDDEPVRMLPADAYTSPEVLAWERRHLYAASWTALGRPEDLLPTTGGRPVRQRAVRVGDVACLLTRDGERVRMFANTCRHRGHELLAEGEGSERPSILCPYHAWTYDLAGAVRAAPGFRDVAGFDRPSTASSSCRSSCGRAGSSGTRCTALGDPAVPSFRAHLGDLARAARAVRRGGARGRRPAHLRGRGELEGRSPRTTTSATTAR